MTPPFSNSSGVVWTGSKNTFIAKVKSQFSLLSLPLIFYLTFENLVLNQDSNLLHTVTISIILIACLFDNVTDVVKRNTMLFTLGMNGLKLLFKHIPVTL